LGAAVGQPGRYAAGVRGSTIHNIRAYLLFTLTAREFIEPDVDVTPNLVAMKAGCPPPR
jgi:hypothetical protein